MNDISEIKEFIESKKTYLASIKTLKKGDMVKDEKGFLYIVDEKTNEDWTEQRVCHLNFDGSIFDPSESIILPLEGTIIKDNRPKCTITKNVFNEEETYTISIIKENSSKIKTIKKDELIYLYVFGRFEPIKVKNVITDEILISFENKNTDDQSKEKLYKVYDIEKFIELFLENQNEYIKETYFKKWYEDKKKEEEK